MTPVIRNDRTMLPIRFIAESFGYTVDWTQETQTVTISKSDSDTDSSEDTMSAATPALNVTPSAAASVNPTPTPAVSETSYDEESPDAEYDDLKTYEDGEGDYYDQEEDE